MTPPVLEIERLVVRYGSFTALHGLSARFDGGALGLLGPNGAGKSSLLRCILGLVRPAGGSVRISGQDARRAAGAVRRRIGYMPERDSYIPGMSGVRALAHLAEVCALKPGDAMLRAHDVLHFVGLGEERYREVASYSVGMRQRWKLAAALVHDPDILFLDEPTNGLDPRGRARMLELLDRVRREHGLHLILASHLLPDVERLCDEVWLLDEGHLKMADTITNLTAAARGAKRVRTRLDAVVRLTEAARSAGFEVAAGGGDGELVLTRAAAPVEPAEVFALARSCDAPVLSIRHAARSLEDAFLEALENG